MNPSEKTKHPLKIFLSNPPWEKTGFFAVRAGSRWPHFEEAHLQYMPFPFFLAHATSWLEKHGFSPKLTDSLAMRQKHKDFYADVKNFSPDLLCMEISSFSIKNDLMIAKEIKKICPNTKIAFMGLASEMQEETFVRKNRFVDFFLVGEYEDTLLELAIHLRDQLPFSSLPGMTFIGQDGSFSGFTRRELRADINVYPWPSRNQLPMHCYHDEPGNIPAPSVQMWASRGCPYKCIFCAWPQIMYGNHQYRTRDIIDLADEFEWLVNEWGFRSVYFDDDTFNVNKKRIASFSQELIKRGLKTPWAAMSRADLVDENLLKIMRKSGCHALKFGIESADQLALNQMDKGLNIEKAVENIRLTHNYGIKTHLTFMFGLPGETRESCQKTLNLALDLNPESLQMTIASPFPGSRFMKHLQEKNHLVCDVSEADGFRKSCVKTDAMSAEELEEFVQKAQNQWLIHKASQRTSYGIGFRQEQSISVIIPNYNGESFIRPCLQSVLRQTVGKVEVIVIDNGSTDKSVSMIQSEFPEVKLVQFPSNNGFAFAINAGIKIASGSCIALLNNDAKADPSWLEKMQEALHSDKKIGFVACKVLSYHNPKLVDSAGDGLTSGGRAYNVGNSNPDGKAFETKRWVFGATGAACLFKRSLLEDVGDFDESFFMYLEDVDYSFRAQIKGYRCVYEPKAIVYHIGSMSANRTLGLKTYYLTRNWFSLVIKNFPKSHLKSNFFLLALHLLITGIRHVFFGGSPISWFRGVRDGIKQIQPALQKRKKILGGRRINDEEFEKLFLFGDINWKLTRKNRVKPPSRHEIQISK